METIRRYSMRMGNMEKDTVRRSILNPSKSVPKRFLDTPGRQQMKMVLRLFGMVFFSMTVMAILGSLVALIFPIGKDALSFSILGLFLLNLGNTFGMFAELAGDGGGVNWFARGFLLSIVSFGSGFLIFAFIGLF